MQPGLRAQGDLHLGRSSRTQRNQLQRLQKVALDDPDGNGEEGQPHQVRRRDVD